VENIILTSGVNPAADAPGTGRDTTATFATHVAHLI
jgi:hypothetical protein